MGIAGQSSPLMTCACQLLQIEVMFSFLVYLVSFDMLDMCICYVKKNPTAILKVVHFGMYN